jgi:hypothetical protein
MSNNTCPPRITAAAGTKLARAFSLGTVIILPKYRALQHTPSITHAISLGQTCVHCPRFPTAASKLSLDLVSIPMWLIVLSDQLRITGLVSHYLTNYLILHKHSINRSKIFNNVHDININKYKYITIKYTLIRNLNITRKLQ